MEHKMKRWRLDTLKMAIHKVNYDEMKE